MASGRREHTPKILGFDEISKMLEGHFAYLLHHLAFINDIKKDEATDSDIEAYFLDVFGIKSVDKDILNNKILPTLKKTIDHKIKETKRLLLSTKIENKDQAICYLNLLLEYQLAYSAVEKNIKNSKHVRNSDKIQAVFHHHDYLKPLHQALQHHLPDDIIADFKKVFRIEECLTREQKKEGLDMTFFTNVQINWDGFLRELKFELKQFLNQIEKNKKFNKVIVPARFLDQALNAMKEISMKKSDNANKFTNTPTDEQLNHLIKSNIDFFFQIYPLAREPITLIHNKIKEIADAEKLAAHYKQDFDKIKREIASLNKQYELCLNLAKQYKKTNPDKVAVFLKDLKDLYDNIQKLSQAFPADCPNENKEQINDRLNHFYENYHQLIQKLDHIHQETLDYHASVKAEQAAKKIELEKLEKNQKETIAVLQKQREDFLLQKKSLCQKYKDEVLKKKEAKKHQTVLTIPMPLESKKEDCVTYKNPAREELLENLSNNNLALIKSILNLEDSVTYHEIYHLITNQLDGKITEIGNGSSHKRIQIENFYTEMITENDEIKNDTPIATGGFFKPHGKAHNSGILSRFNLKLVQSTLIKAGLTPKVIEELEQKKERLKVLSPNNGKQA